MKKTIIFQNRRLCRRRCMDWWKIILLLAFVIRDFDNFESMVFSLPCALASTTSDLRSPPSNSWVEAKINNASTKASTAPSRFKYRRSDLERKTRAGKLDHQRHRNQSATQHLIYAFLGTQSIIFPQKNEGMISSRSRRIKRRRITYRKTLPLLFSLQQPEPNQSLMPMAAPPPTSAAHSLYSLLLQHRQNRGQNNSAIPLAGIHDALSAKIFAQHGAPALFLSGFGVSVSLLGLPDAGMTNLVEMEIVARNVCSAVREAQFQKSPTEPMSVPPPVIVDGDTGYGGSSNMIRTITSLASAGAAAITIEDQIFPKKCTIAAGDKIQIIEREDAIRRVRAALGARDLYESKIGLGLGAPEGESGHDEEMGSDVGNGLWIVARTDCRLSRGFEEVIERCLHFEELGADIVYAENLQSVKEYEELRQRLDEKTVCMVAQVQETLQVGESAGRGESREGSASGGKPLLTIQQIGQLGYDLALFGVTPLQCVVGALEKTAVDFLGCNNDCVGGTGIIGRNKDTQKTNPMADFATVKRVVGFDKLEDFERDFPCG